MATDPVAAILKPRSIAVVGASAQSGNFGYRFTSLQVEQGYKGPIYPVNPKYTEAVGLKCYPRLRDIPGPVDYVVSAVPAEEVLNILADCPEKGVKAVHLFTARFSETGRSESADLEREILRRARSMGIRLIGPNCMGLYDPEHGMAFTEGSPKEPGSVGLLSQSGQIAGELIRNCGMRGIRFTQGFSYGNALDFNECDFIDYFAQDKKTRVILAYIEGVRDGRRFVGALRRAAATKPVILLKGGQGVSGARAISSHTASMASSKQIWEAIINQCGAITAEDLDEMIDLAASFYFLPPIRGVRAAVSVGAGGGTVLAADACEAAGLDVIPLPEEIREQLKSKGVPIWDWIGNPADFSISYDFTTFNATHLLKMMAENPNFDFLITSVGIPFRRDTQGPPSIDAFLQPYLEMKQLKPLLGIVGDRMPTPAELNDPMWKMLGEMRVKLVDCGIPFYPTIGRAARAVRKLVGYYQRKE